jgi:DNA-binding transcriptional ArsR family regulator
VSVAPVEVFAALGDPTRQRLLDVVAQGGGSAAEMAALLDITRQAVEKQLRVLEDAGVVQRVHLGRRVRFAVRTDALAETATWLSSLADTWDRRLAAVKALAESEAPPPVSTRPWR